MLLGKIQDLRVGFHNAFMNVLQIIQSEVSAKLQIERTESESGKATQLQHRPHEGNTCGRNMQC